jgi:hypothetical protein
MTTVHAPGTGLGGDGLGKRSRQAAVAAAVVLAFVAIVVPFVVHALQDRDPATSRTLQRTSPQTTPSSGRHHTSSTDPSTDSALGARGDLPSLLPAGGMALSEGQPVRVGYITTGTLHHAATTGWQVLVRWDGRVQPLPTRGPVSVGTRSWVSQAGLLYSRVPTGTPGRFHVYAWSPIGGTAYTPPTLVATSLGDVCFDPAFTAFGGCAPG